MKKVYQKNKKTTPKVVNQKQPKKRETAAWILAILMIIWTIGSVLGSIGFAKSCNADTIPTASAEAVEDSIGSGTKMPSFVSVDLPCLTGLTLPGDDDYNSRIYWITSGRYCLEFNSSGGLLFLGTGIGDVEVDLLDESLDSEYFQYFFLSTEDNVTCTELAWVEYDDKDLVYSPYKGIVPLEYTLSWAYESTMLGSGAARYQVYVYKYNVSIEWFNVSMSSVGVTNLTVCFTTPYIAYPLPIYFPYLDTCITLRSSVTQNVFYKIGSWSWSYSDSYIYMLKSVYTRYDDGYQDGMKDGYSLGEKYGLEQGKELGVEYGRKQGYEDGYMQGVAESNEYSFAGFLGAIFDVPVQTFQSLFTFEILGVDLSGLLLGLLTCMIALAIVKLIV